MLGIVFLISVGFLIVLGLLLAVITACRQDGESAKTVGVIVGCYFAAIVALIAEPVTFLARCLTALYGIADISWSATWLCLVSLGLAVIVLRRVGLLVLSSEKGGA